MATELEQLEVELKRTQLQRERLALHDDLNRRTRPARMIEAAQVIGGAGAKAASKGAAAVIDPAARLLLFVIYWGFYAAIGCLLFASGDLAHVGGGFELRLGYYVFWGVPTGLVVALLSYPWKKGGPLLERDLLSK